MRSMAKFDSAAALCPPGQQTVVIKVGTSSLLRDEKHSLNLASIAGLVEACRDLRDQGMNVILVSSGAVGVGCQRMGLEERPSLLAQKQAMAAVGQLHLMRCYDDLFSILGMTCAQVLLTLDNLANRSQYINARNTFSELLHYGAIPVVNENDTVAVEQLRFSENDTLSAQVATLVQADWLFLLTDVDCLYTANPHTDPNAEPIHEVHDMRELQVDTSTKGTQWGTGGMATKLTAARIATAAGCKMAICNASNPRNILGILAGERVGTVFHPISCPLKGRKRWILSVPVKGELWLNPGAINSPMDRHTSLFSPGIIKVTGDFGTQECVQLLDEDGVEIGRGLVNYTSHEINQIKGMPSRSFHQLLGYMGPEEIVHRANCCLLVDTWHEHDDHHHNYSAGTQGEQHPQANGGGHSRTNTAPASLEALAAVGSGEAAAAAAKAHGSGAGPSARPLWPAHPPLPRPPRSRDTSPHRHQADH